jgi:hypothetical protein
VERDADSTNGNEGLKRLQRFRGSDGCRQRVVPDIPVVGACRAGAQSTPLAKIAVDCSRLQFLGRLPAPSRTRGAIDTNWGEGGSKGRMGGPLKLRLRSATTGN